jgi:hypothetical protein
MNSIEHKQTENEKEEKKTARSISRLMKHCR